MERGQGPLERTGRDTTAQRSGFHSAFKGGWCRLSRLLMQLMQPCPEYSPDRQNNGLSSMTEFRVLIFVAWLVASPFGFAQAQSAAPVRFRFRESKPTTYRLESGAPGRTIPRDWVKAWPENASRFPVEFGSRVVLRLKPGTQVGELLKDSPPRPGRAIAPDLYIVHAADALTALSEAQRLSDRPEVLGSCPVRRRLPIRLHGDRKSVV